VATKIEPSIPKRQRPAETALVVLAVLAVIAAAKIAEPFLIPVIVGMLTSYALKPLVATLERWHVHRAIGSAVVLVLLMGAIAGGVFLLRDDATAAIAELPNAARKVRLAAHESARQPHVRHESHVRPADRVRVFGDDDSRFTRQHSPQLMDPIEGLDEKVRAASDLAVPFM